MAKSVPIGKILTARFPNSRGINMEEVNKLVPSVKDFGILSALWVKGPNSKGEYNLIAGFEDRGSQERPHRLQEGQG